MVFIFEVFDWVVQLVFVKFVVKFVGFVIGVIGLVLEGVGKYDFVFKVFWVYIVDFCE